VLYDELAAPYSAAYAWGCSNFDGSECVDANFAPISLPTTADMVIAPKALAVGEYTFSLTANAGTDSAVATALKTKVVPFCIMLELQAFSRGQYATKVGDAAPLSLKAIIDPSFASDAPITFTWELSGIPGIINNDIVFFDNSEEAPLFPSGSTVTFAVKATTESAALGATLTGEGEVTVQIPEAPSGGYVTFAADSLEMKTTGWDDSAGALEYRFFAVSEGSDPLDNADRQYLTFGFATSTVCTSSYLPRGEIYIGVIVKSAFGKACSYINVTLPRSTTVESAAETQARLDMEAANAEATGNVMPLAQLLSMTLSNVASPTAGAAARARRADLTAVNTPASDGTNSTLAEGVVSAQSEADQLVIVQALEFYAKSINSMGHVAVIDNQWKALLNLYANFPVLKYDTVDKAFITSASLVATVLASTDEYVDKVKARQLVALVEILAEVIFTKPLDPTSYDTKLLGPRKLVWMESVVGIWRDVTKKFVVGPEQLVNHKDFVSLGAKHIPSPYLSFEITRLELGRNDTHTFPKSADGLVRADAVTHNFLSVASGTGSAHIACVHLNHTNALTSHTVGPSVEGNHLALSSPQVMVAFHDDDGDTIESVYELIIPLSVPAAPQSFHKCFTLVDGAWSAPASLTTVLLDEGRILCRTTLLADSAPSLVAVFQGLYASTEVTERPTALAADGLTVWTQINVSSAPALAEDKYALWKGHMCLEMQEHLLNLEAASGADYQGFPKHEKLFSASMYCDWKGVASLTTEPPGDDSVSSAPLSLPSRVLDLRLYLRYVDDNAVTAHRDTLLDPEHSAKVRKLLADSSNIARVQASLAERMDRTVIADVLVVNVTVTTFDFPPEAEQGLTVLEQSMIGLSVAFFLIAVGLFGYWYHGVLYPPQMPPRKSDPEISGIERRKRASKWIPVSTNLQNAKEGASSGDEDFDDDREFSPASFTGSDMLGETGPGPVKAKVSEQWAALMGGESEQAKDGASSLGRFRSKAGNVVKSSAMKRWSGVVDPLLGAIQERPESGDSTAEANPKGWRRPTKPTSRPVSVFDIPGKPLTPRSSTNQTSPPTRMPMAAKTAPAAGKLPPPTGMPMAAKTAPAAGKLSPPTGMPTAAKTAPAAGKLLPPAGMPMVAKQQPQSPSSPPSRRPSALSRRPSALSRRPSALSMGGSAGFMSENVLGPGADDVDMALEQNAIEVTAQVDANRYRQQVVTAKARASATLQAKLRRRSSMTMLSPRGSMQQSPGGTPRASVTAAPPPKFELPTADNDETEA